jgi:DNA gyrase/topoisomerase IV subunit A
VRRREKEPTLDEQIEDLERRLEIYAALQTALSNPHDLLQILLDSAEPDSAVPALRSRLGFTEIGAMAVLDLQFRRVTSQERGHISEECDETRAHLEELRRRAADAQQ